MNTTQMAEPHVPIYIMYFDLHMNLLHILSIHMDMVKVYNFLCNSVPFASKSRGVLVFLKFGQFSSKLTKTWSSGATKCGA